MKFEIFLKEKLEKEHSIPKEKLDTLLEKATPERSFISLIIGQKMVDEDTVLLLLTRFYGIPSLNLNFYRADPAVVSLLPVALAQKFNILPLFRIRNTLMLAMENPSDIHAMDEVRIKTFLGVEPVIALPESLKNAIAQMYSLGKSAVQIMDEITDEKIGITTGENAAAEELGSGIDDEPIVKLVNLFIAQAVRQGASDIHVNPEEKSLRIRFRVDGMLHEIAMPPKKFEPAIVSRIKVLANLDIAEKRKPQDGRIKMRMENKVVDLRVSTFPTIYGENVVMRLLDASNVMLGLDEIGFLPRDLEIFSNAIKKPYGIILVTGPTGSGKTTTLYSALEMINSVDKNIITLEDPVEYNLNMIRQGQVNYKAGFDFAAGLRAILRQDPDVIMVGEIRDGETAHIAIEAALTGHLVFSTLHTNDSVGAIARLADMGVEHFLLASSVLCVVAQRLLRRICKECKEQYTPTEESLKEVGISPKQGMQFYRGVGCARCFNTGYRGRVGIYEILVITQGLRNAILKNKTADEIKKIALEEGTRFLRDDGLEKVKLGFTTIEEVLRVTREE